MTTCTQDVNIKLPLRPAEFCEMQMCPVEHQTDLIDILLCDEVKCDIQGLLADVHVGCGQCAQHIHEHVLHHRPMALFKFLHRNPRPLAIHADSVYPVLPQICGERIWHREMAIVPQPSFQKG
jgi:hypothetical protein